MTRVASQEIKKNLPEKMELGRGRKSFQTQVLHFWADPIFPPPHWAAVVVPVTMNVNELLMRS